MKAMKTARAIGEIDEKFIEEAAPGKRITVKMFPWKATAIAACLALVICIGAMAVLFGRFDIQTGANSESSSQTDSSNADANSKSADSQTKWEKKVITPDDQSKPDIAIEKQWDSMTASEKFSEIKQPFNYGNRITYYSTDANIEKSKIGSLLYNCMLESFDSSKGQAHHALAEVYEIMGVSRDVAVAVYLIEGDKVDSIYDKYSGSYQDIREHVNNISNDNYFVYISTEFRADTLYSFALCTGLNNVDDTKYPVAYYHEKGSNKTIEFEGIDKKMIRDLLFSDGANNKEVTDADEFLTKGEHRTIMSLSVSIETIGIKNKSISITEDGYLWTNILSTARVYNIGKAKAEKIVNYIIGTCKGYELVNDSSDSSAASAE